MYICICFPKHGTNFSEVLFYNFYVNLKLFIEGFRGEEGAGRGGTLAAEEDSTF